MSDNIRDSVWESIETSIHDGSLSDVIEIFTENRLDYTATGGKYEGTALHLAAQQGKCDIAEYIISQVVDVKNTDNFGGTSKENVDVSELLLKRRALVNSADKHGATALWFAAYHNNVRLADLLLEGGADIDSVDDYGFTALMVAAKGGNVEISELLLKHGALVNSATKAGQTALQYAAYDNNVKLAELLLEGGADIDGVNTYGITALMVAARRGNVEVSALLLKRGALVNSADKTGHTALWQAIDHNKMKVVELLLEGGTDIESVNNDGDTPLILAAKEQNVEVAKLLLEQGAQVNCKNKVEDTALWFAAYKNNFKLTQLLFSHGADVAGPLLRATRQNNMEMIQLLNGLGTEVDGMDDNRNISSLIADRVNSVEVTQRVSEQKAQQDSVTSPPNNEMSQHISNSIWVNIKHSVESRNLADIIKVYKEKTLDYNARDGFHKQTVLHLAAEKGRGDIVKYLIDQGADLDNKDWQGSTPLLRAAYRNNVKVIQMLSGGGADVEIMDNDGDTAVMEAVKKENVELTQFLLGRGALVNTTNNAGETPLWLAADKNNIKLAQVLVHRGADVATPLLRATSENNVRAVQFLIELEADVDTKNGVGDTLLWIAAQMNHKEVAQLLSNHGANVAALLVRAVRENNDKIVQLLIEVGAVAIIQNLEMEEDEYTDELEQKLKNALNKAIERLPSVINDPKQRFVFFKGKLYHRLITIFLERGGDDTSLLRTIYIALQAKVKCDQPKREMLKMELGTISGLYERFYRRMEMLSTDHPVSSKSAHLNVIADQIFWEYLEKKEKTCDKVSRLFQSTVQKLKSCCRQLGDCWPTICCNVCQICSTLCGKMKNKLRSCYRCFDCRPPIPTEAKHNCEARSNTTVILCTLGIVFYILDLSSDVIVGIEDYNGFSQKLGLFELLLVVFTLCHENLRSSSSAYTTEEELLKIEFGKFDIKAEDWKKSSLNWSTSWYKLIFYKLFWPFKVLGRPGMLNKLKAILYNILTCLQLRPVVDRLVILLHAPTSLREYYRRQAEQNCLKQFYLILEQLPEILVQFYTFQIAYNNLTGSQLRYSETQELVDNGPCYHYFNESRMRSDNTNNTNLFCGTLSLSDDGLRTCGTVFRIFSMAIPFYNIPSGIASLEHGLGKLDPLTPKMSTTLKIIFQASYMLMIPARVFMFAALMHALHDKEYVFAFIVLRAFLELFVNLFSLKDDPTLFEGSLGTKASTCWRLCLFSIRDVFLISIRDPVAYLSKPSEVSYTSLRSWENIAVRVIPFICEGLIGTLIIEHRYPCGKHSYHFKYLGWYCVILLFLSLSAIITISDLYHPLKTPRSTSNRNSAKALLIGLVSVFISGIAALAFSISQPRSVVELQIMGLVIILSILFNVGLTLFIKSSSTVKEIAKYPEKRNVSARIPECEENGEPNITKLEEGTPSLDVPTSSAQNIAPDIKEEIGSVEYDGPSYLELDESTTPLLDEPLPTVEHIGLTVMEDIRFEENGVTVGNPKLEDGTPSFDESSSSANSLTLKFGKGTSSEENDEPDVPLLDESSSSFQNIALDVLKEIISKENVNTSTVSDSMC